MAKMLAQFLLLSVALAAQQPRHSEEGKRSSAAGSSSLTGCVDQRPGGYILIEPVERKEIAELQPVAFEKEGLAKHLGHKVSVRGKLERDGERAIMKVQSVQHISETCSTENSQDTSDPN